MPPPADVRESDLKHLFALVGDTSPPALHAAHLTHAKYFDTPENRKGATNAMHKVPWEFWVKGLREIQALYVQPQKEVQVPGRAGPSGPTAVRQMAPKKRMPGFQIPAGSATRLQKRLKKM